MNEGSGNRSSIWVVLAVLLVFLGLVAFGIYFLIFSPLLANDPLVVPIRHFYVQTSFAVREKLGVPDGDNYSYVFSPFWVVGVNLNGFAYNGNNYKYVYSFSGKLEEIDENKGVIYFRCCNNQTFGFKVYLNPDPANRFLTVGGLKPFSINTNGLPDNTNETKELNRSSIYTIFWADKRTLVKILDDLGFNPDPIVNQDVKDIMNMVE